MMKRVKKLLALVLSLALVLGGVSLAGIEPVSAKEPFTFGGDAIEGAAIKEFTSLTDFVENGVEGGQAEVIFKGLPNEIASITANQDCIVYLHGTNDGYNLASLTAYTNAECTVQAVTMTAGEGTINSNGNLDRNPTKLTFLKKGSSLYFKGGYNAHWGAVTVGYTPVSDFEKAFSLSYKKGSGGVLITAKATDSTAKIRLKAADEGVGYSTYLKNGGNAFPYGDEIFEKGLDTVTLESGKYSLLVLLGDASKQNCTPFIVDVDLAKEVKDSGSKTSKLEAPLVALAKTNVVVGYATPNAKVSVKQGKKTYTATADDTGLYAVITGKLKKGSTIKIWEGTDSTGKAALSVKIK